MDFEVLSALLSQAMASHDKIYMIIVGIFVVMQMLKMVYGKKSVKMRKATPQITAGLSAGAGAYVSSQMGQDPVSGAVLGALMGNATSGMYDTLKPVGSLLKKQWGRARK